MLFLDSVVLGTTSSESLAYTNTLESSLMYNLGGFCTVSAVIMMCSESVM